LLNEKYSYSTQRLLVREWHSLVPEEWIQQDLEVVVKNILTTQVTRSLPPVWQGIYSHDRARDWVLERDDEGVTLLAVEKISRKPIGLIILFETDNGPGGSELRLGYMLAESAWGKGLASEFISGFVEWCRNNEIASVTSGVERDNIASRRVLEKNGFVCEPSTKKATELLFVLHLRHNK